MPYININEIDNTQYGLSTTDNTNIVYCPINAICGTYEPTLIKSYDELIKVYGNSGCIDDISFDYVKDIILSGFPVLCKRIEYKDVDSSSDGIASVNIGTASSKISAKYHGTYLNTVKVNPKWDKRTIHSNGVNLEQNVVTIQVVNKNNSTLESAVFYDTLSTKASTDYTEISTQINNYEFNYIEFDIKGDDLKSFAGIGGNSSAVSTWTLSGGKDLSNTNNVVADKLLSSYGYYSSSEGSNKSLYEKYLGFLNDKYLWEVKFITSGGYTTSTTETEKAAFLGMVSLCDPDYSGRGDCIALLDIDFGVPKDSVKNHFTSVDTTYAVAYAPWCYEKLRSGSKSWMPPSFTFLINLASAVSSGTPIYYPPAGVNRMKCRRTIKTEYEIGSAILNSWQPKTNDGQCINPIMNIRGEGYAVYGQRTLVNLVSPVMQTSLKSVTVRLCAIEIKKAIFNASIRLTFEQNILRTWNEFKSDVETKLLEMKKNGGLNSYQIIMDRSTISESDLNNNIARGIVRCAINDALENFEIGFEISPSYVSFDEEQDTIEASNEIDALS